MGNEDIPSPIDFRDPAEARKWADEADVKRPWRAEFFQAIAQQLNEYCPGKVKILELGSGPGCLAEYILAHCGIGSYTLLDFAPAMHELARERLARYKNVVQYIVRDFKSPDWWVELGDFDAVVTMQAAHEVRHKRHVPKLCQQVNGLLRPTGCFLVCDHYYSALGKRNPDLFMTLDEQKSALEEAGFRNVSLVLDKGEMSLFRALRRK